jgi:CRISPR-associated protein Cas7/Cse4/CasC subtype I-E
LLNIRGRLKGKASVKKRALAILKGCGIKSKNDDTSDMLIYTTWKAIDEMAQLLGESEKNDKAITEDFKALISQKTAVPDMALSGRMLETGEIKDTTVEASLQVAHAISTHEARPEVDYYVAADDIHGDGAGYVDEAMFASACFYKYFSIHWEGLVENLKGNEALAAHTVGAFLRGCAMANPTGKQNSFAAHNCPDGILVEIREENTPISYANAFADPVKLEQKRDLISQSVAQLSQYINDMDTGYGCSSKRFWFSPNLRHQLSCIDQKEEKQLTTNNLGSFDQLVQAVVDETGQQWSEVQKEIIEGVS